jgi:putative toxin-antitoxin system antitoxin component (TIGR02293 family)
MEKKKDSIVASISKKTGSSEEVTDKIITEFGKVLREAAIGEKTTVVPDLGYISVVPAKTTRGAQMAKRISKASNWYLIDIKTTQGQISTGNQPAGYRVFARRHIIDELKSNKKSNEILERFSEFSSIPNKFLAEKVLEISPKTLYSYRHSNKILPIRINEQILKLEDLYKKGIELFENSDRFNQWMKSEAYGLGNVKPIEMINSITGIDLIYEELIRIEFGATA